VIDSAEPYPGLASPQAAANGVSSGPPLRDFVQIGPQQTSFPGDPEEARAQFQQFHAIGIRSLLEPSFLKAPAAETLPASAKWNSPRSAPAGC